MPAGPSPTNDVHHSAAGSPPEWDTDDSRVAVEDSADRALDGAGEPDSSHTGHRVPHSPTCPRQRRLRPFSARATFSSKHTAHTWGRGQSM